MAYQAWSVTAGSQPTTAYWNILGSNDAAFNTALTGSGTIASPTLAMFGNMVTLSSPASGTFTTTTKLQSASITIPANCNKCLVMGNIRMQNENNALEDMSAYAYVGGNQSEISYFTSNSTYEGSSMPILDVISVTPGAATTAEIWGNSNSFSCSSAKVMFMFFGD